MNHSNFSKFFPLLIAGAAAVSVSCVKARDGLQPEHEQIYFPVAVAVAKSTGNLLVVNSDFDLQYNQGTVQSLSIDRIVELLPVPCSDDEACGSGEHCDVKQTTENRNRPSFFCVDDNDPRPCGELGDKSDGMLALSPGRCAPVSLEKPHDGGASVLVDVAEIPAFATQGLLLERPCEQDDGTLEKCQGEPGDKRIKQLKGASREERYFIPLRGNTTILYLDIDDDGHFECGRKFESQNLSSYRDVERGSKDLRCDTSDDSAYSVWEGTTYAVDNDGELTTTEQPPDPAEEDDEDEDDDDNPLDEYRLQPEPLELAATDDGRIIVVSHQLRGRISALLNDWQRPPSLIVAGDVASDKPIGVASFSGPSSAEPAFLLTYRSDTRVDLLRFQDDDLLDTLDANRAGDESSETTNRIFRPELISVASTEITTNTGGGHSRGVLVDDSRRAAAVAACGNDEDCVQVAQLTALDVYVANRGPSSMLVGKTSGADLEAQTSQLPIFYDNVPLSAGPSRIVRGFITDMSGEQQMRIFVICYDSATIFVYDPVHRRVESTIFTGRGPYSMAFDEESSLAFIGHFTDSYVGVISLDMRIPSAFGKTLLTLDAPEVPRANQ